MQDWSSNFTALTISKNRFEEESARFYLLFKNRNHEKRKLEKE